MMKGREIKGSGQSGYTKGTKMFRTRHYLVFGGLAYSILMTLCFYQLEAPHKLSSGIKSVDDYFKSERENRFKEVLARRVKRSEKFSQDHESKSL